MKLGVRFVVACAFALPACTSGADRACTVGAECASGVCRGDGTCAPAGSDGGAGLEGGATGGDGGSADGASDDGASLDAPTQGDGAGTGCLPNHDGTILRTEIPLGPGLHAKYTVAQSAPVSTGGTAQPDGSRVWDLTGALSGDHSLLVETLAPTGQWFAGDFPQASYTARLTDSSDLLGVFQTTPSAILLLGAVSPSSGANATELPNSAGVPSLAFPMKMGSSWNSNVTINGKVNGVPTLYGDAYESSVDAHGLMKTPYADFQVLRINTKLTRSVGGVPSLILRTYAYVAECAGPVATILSQNNETQVEFTTAAEVQRLGK